MQIARTTSRHVGPTDYLALEDSALIAQCRMDRYRASGPGGQKRNKTESAVRLVHEPTGMVAVATESRSQHENRARALRRLRLAIALGVRRSVTVESYQPGQVMRSCMDRTGRLHLGRRDYRYLSVVQELLDVFFACGAQLSTTARLIGVGSAHLGRFLRNDPALWRRVNEMRQAAGRKPLKSS